MVCMLPRNCYDKISRLMIDILNNVKRENVGYYDAYCLELKNNFLLGNRFRNLL